MTKALALFEDGPRFVKRSKAVRSGRCYFCGQLLNNHPRNIHGEIRLNRHHEINRIYTAVYEEVTGKPYPTPRHGLYWVGMGCHIDYHKRFDLQRRIMADLGSRMRQASCDAQLAEVHEELKQVLIEFLEHTAENGSGRFCLSQPTPLPQPKPRAAAA